ncbi:hypothetical protein AB0I49_22020 [Streptomyces sp. NPDC050617]|uniref:hypothetical protein n=1 Tax=Streptomyces sp. NPDC050617 TaxID=3154628 RepID=UPI0034319E4F
MNALRKARLVAAHEGRTAVSLGLWAVRRRDGVGGGTEGFGYARAQASMLYSLVFVAVIETAGLAVLLSGFPVAHLITLVIDLYGVLFVLGLHAAAVTRPHTVGPAGLRVRAAARLDLLIAPELIASVRRDVRFPAAKAPDDVLELPIAGQTSVTVELTEPVGYRTLLGAPRHTRTIRCHADDPAALIASVRARCYRRRNQPERPLTPARTAPSAAPVPPPSAGPAAGARAGAAARPGRRRRGR